jgi:ribosomal protein S12 methylthiotransferase accessory factor
MNGVDQPLLLGPKYPRVERPKLYRLDGSHRLLTPEQTRGRLLSNPAVSRILVESASLIVSGLGVPVFFLKSRVVPGTGHTDRIMGKGFTESQAFCSAVMEAVERFCCSLHGDDEPIRASYRALDDRAVDPESLGVFRDGPYSPVLPLDWIRAWNVTRQREALVPVLQGLYVSSSLRHWYYDCSEPAVQFTHSDTNGCASGNCLEEAVAHGLYELIERDALTILARCHCRPPQVELPEDAANPYLRALLERIDDDQRLELNVKYLTMDLEIPIFAAVIQYRDSGLTVIGYGAHLDPQVALLRALTEAAQARALLQRRYGSDTQPLQGRGIPPERIDYLQGNPGRIVPFESLPCRASDDLSRDVDFLIDLLAARDLEVLIVDRTRCELGVATVKVLVPRLQRVDWTWLYDRRLLAAGSDRIYRVPVDTGFLDRPRTFEELDAAQITFQ